MQLNSPLSATTRPFQPWATPLLALVDDIPLDYPAQNGLARGSPTRGSTTGLPVKGTTPTTITPLMRKGYPLIPSPLRSRFVRSGAAGEIEVTGVVVTPMRLSSLEGGKRKRMGSLARSKSLNLEARRAILMMSPMPLGSGPFVSLITVNTMRIPTSCP